MSARTIKQRCIRTYTLNIYYVYNAYMYTDTLHNFPSERTILFEFMLPYPKLYVGCHVSI